MFNPVGVGLGRAIALVLMLNPFSIPNTDLTSESLKGFNINTSILDLGPHKHTPIIFIHLRITRQCMHGFHPFIK